MSERFGFFTIFVLGESVIAVGNGLQGVEWRFLGVVTAIVGFSAAVWMWWLYFERADERAEGSVISQAVRSGKWDLLLSFVYGYGHYFTYAGIVAAPIGVQASIEATAESEAHSPSADVSPYAAEFYSFCLELSPTTGLPLKGLPADRLCSPAC